MQQLSGLDSSFLYLETGTTPMHIGSLSIYDQSTAPGGHVTFKDILNFFQQRLHKARAFRQRVVRVPLSLDHPYWIEDPDFDLEFHVRHIALPKPGDWRQLCIQTARLHARPLDRNRPLWEAYVIEGLDNVDGVPKGSFALVTKIHHAAIDGISGAAITEAIHDLTPDAEVDEPTQPWVPERLPTGIELLTKSAIRTVNAPAKFGRLLYRSAPAFGRVVGGLATGQLRMPFTVPRTRFNGHVSPHRVFTGSSFSLDEVKAIKDSQPGTTVNDVVVTVCSGAMRRYLDAKHELPQDSMVAMIPMSVRADEQRKAAGNLVTAMSLRIRSDIADPLERLLAVNQEGLLAKKLTHTMGPNLAADAAEFLPSTVSGLVARMYANSGVADRIPPLFNTVITNVPGPNMPLYSMGSRMVSTYGLGPVVHGLGLFQTVLSYNNSITISAVADRDMMPDPAFYNECLRASFDELKAATIDLGAASAADAPPKTTRPAAARKKKPAARKAATSRGASAGA
ncbi:MAG: wax ester/triacylglycerol synthase family O-acyltransferase [Gammaproteobacteria bacterium]|nr:wax ester/triacylglycerol synthase family O-acyltransferase [Gammaproteobacteria bacterium]MDH5309419.1 wax ester/triacylglycerol synthase family O-acyltransferase [Gammaproteobacteria bacterium]